MFVVGKNICIVIQNVLGAYFSNIFQLWFKKKNVWLCEIITKDASETKDL